MHSLILGQTEYGKTVLAQELAKQFYYQRYGVMVLDPFLDRSAWKCQYMTEDPRALVATIKKSSKCFVFVDETGEFIDGKFKTELNFLAKRSRHYGMSVFFIAQRAIADIPPQIRTQANAVYTFSLHPKDAESLARDFNRPELVKMVPKLKKGEFIKVMRNDDPLQVSDLFKHMGWR